MCTKLNGDDFVTIHHELGHNYYQRAYNQQPYLYLNGANDGFHEAIGDAVALSITPEYLVQIGLLDRAKVPSADKDIGLDRKSVGSGKMVSVRVDLGGRRTINTTNKNAEDRHQTNKNN